jgi:hypothetical protein
MNLSAQPVDGDVGLDKGMTYPRDFVSDGREINGHFVGKGTLEFSIGSRRSLGCDPRVVDAPGILHGCW